MSGGGWDLEEIRRRADIVDIVSPHVRLRKAGRRLVGLCPFHRERTGSFTVDAEKGLWHCFGCKAGGDVFRFVEMIEKVDFSDAVEILARRLGLPPPSRADAERTHARERLLLLHERAARFFQRCLMSSTGRLAAAYLQGRGLSKTTAEDFMLGYAQDSWDALLLALSKDGFSSNELTRAGLVVQKEGGGFYDRFRNRLIFPISDATGRVIAFGGRALADDQQPKYLNSPETPLFQKGQTLWAFDRARRAIEESGRAIVVEGYMDAIACHEANFKETVATMGTALTSSHAELLRRRTDRLLLAFDSDSAGLAAALRSRELFERANLDVRVVDLPAGADPDDVIRKQGRDAFAELLDAAKPMVEWEISRVLAQVEDRDGRDWMDAVRDAVSILARIPPGVEREYYVRWLAQIAAKDSPARLKAMEDAIRQDLKRRSPRSGYAVRPAESSPSQETSPPGKAAQAAPGRLSAFVLSALLHHGEHAGNIVMALQPEDFTDDAQRVIFEVIANLIEEGGVVTPEMVLAKLGPEERGTLAQLAMEDVPGEQVEQFLVGVVRRLVEARLLRRQRSLHVKLSEATSEKERLEIREELSEVARRRSELAGERIVGGGQ